MRTRPGLLPLVTAVVLAVPLTGCGASRRSAAYGCTGGGAATCTVKVDHPETVKIDDLGTSVAISDLTADSVRVQINDGAAATVVRGQQSRLDGFLVSANATGVDHAEIRVQR